MYESSNLFRDYVQSPFLGSGVPVYSPDSSSDNGDNIIDLFGSWSLPYTGEVSEEDLHEEQIDIVSYSDPLSSEELGYISSQIEQLNIAVNTTNWLFTGFLVFALFILVYRVLNHFFTF